MKKFLTCCFAGHPKLPISKIEHIIVHLDHEVENLINQGVNTFISGGEPGFDQLAASLVIAKKGMGKKIRLVFALSCKTQEDFWAAKQKGLYYNLLSEADEVIYVSKEYYNGCIKKRNRYMVDQSAYCICARVHLFGGTDQTVKYAKQKGLKIINVAGV